MHASRIALGARVLALLGLTTMGFDPDHALTGVQTWTVPAGGGAVFETVFDKDASGEGVYAFVTHAFADAAKGAVGLVRVGTPLVAAGAGH